MSLNLGNDPHFAYSGQKKKVNGSGVANNFISYNSETILFGLKIFSPSGPLTFFFCALYYCHVYAATFSPLCSRVWFNPAQTLGF